MFLNNKMLIFVYRVKTKNYNVRYYLFLSYTDTVFFCVIIELTIIIKNNIASKSLKVQQTWKNWFNEWQIFIYVIMTNRVL